MDKQLLKASAPNSKSLLELKKLTRGRGGGGFIQPLPCLCCRTAGLNSSNLMITYSRPMSVDGLVTTTEKQTSLFSAILLDFAKVAVSRNADHYSMRKDGRLFI